LSLPPGDCHGNIVGEGKANVKRCVKNSPDICARAAEVSARRNPCGWPKNRKNKLSMQEIDREIRAYRAERSQTVSTSRS
jgi:hypothetical protein